MLRGVAVVTILALLYATQRPPEDDALVNMLTSPYYRIGAGIIAFAAVLGFLLGRLKRARVPEVRAVEAVMVLISWYLLIFAGLYWTMTQVNAGAFSESLDKYSALYFTITIFSTVGFGDITPETSTAQMVVSVQMLLNLIVLGVTIKLLINAAKRRLDDAKAASAAE